MACPPGKGQRCPIHKNSSAQNCDGCKKSYQEVCKSCKRLIPTKNLPPNEISLSENPQVDFCQCVASALSTATDTSSEPMDWDSPRASPHAQKSSGISLTAPSTSRSTARASPQARQSSGISLAEPSKSSATRSHTVESARETDKFMTFAGAKPKGSKGSGSSKHSPETMACSSDVYPLSSEEGYDLWSSKATPKGKKQFRRGPARKKKTSPEKAKEGKSESSPEGFTNFRRTTNISTFGKSAENKISNKDEKFNTSGESDYTLKSSTPNGQSYNIRTRRNKYYASPESDNANNDRFHPINAPPGEALNWSGRQNESYFTSYKENVPFRQGYRPQLPSPFPQYKDSPQILQIPMERSPTFRDRFSGPSPGMSRYQQPYAGSSHDHSVMGLPRGLKPDDERLEKSLKDQRIQAWLETIEPLSPLSSNETIEEHVVPPTMEVADREQGAVGIASSNQSEAETSGTEIYDAEEFSKMSKSFESDESKKTRHCKK